MAVFVCASLVCESDVIYAPILPFDTVWIWSKLIAHSRGIPSFSVRITSLGISLIVDVTGAIVTSPRYSSAEARDRIRTGRFLSGDLNLYHLISPLFNYFPNFALLPRRRTRYWPRDKSHNLFGVSLPASEPDSNQWPSARQNAQKPSGSSSTPLPVDQPSATVLHRVSSVLFS